MGVGFGIRIPFCFKIMDPRIRIRIYQNFSIGNSTTNNVYCTGGSSTTTVGQPLSPYFGGEVSLGAPPSSGPTPPPRPSPHHKTSLPTGFYQTYQQQQAPRWTPSEGERAIHLWNRKFVSKPGDFSETDGNFSETGTEFSVTFYRFSRHDRNFARRTWIFQAETEIVSSWTEIFQSRHTGNLRDGMECSVTLPNFEP